MMNSGQQACTSTFSSSALNRHTQCISPDYVLCHKKVIDQFCQRAAYWARELYGDDPKNNGRFGRIVGEKQAERSVTVLKSSMDA